MNRERHPLNEKIDEYWKLQVNGFAAVLSETLQLPKDLEPEKRGLLPCLFLGIAGIIGLAYVKANWVAYVAEVSLVIIIAMFVIYKSKWSINNKSKPKPRLEQVPEIPHTD